MYETFWSKQSLFLTALECYLNMVVRQRLQCLEDGDSLLGGIRKYFREVVAQAEKGAGIRGCLVTNEIAEWAPHCGKTRELGARCRGQLEEAFFQTLRKARLKNEGASGVHLRKKARFLPGMLQGLAVLVLVLVKVKVQPQGLLLRDYVETGLSILD